MLTKISGYTSVFGNLDSDSDIVVQGAFSKWLEDPSHQHMPIYQGHENVKGPWALPVGVTTLIKEDNYGLYFEGVLIDSPKAQEVVSLIKTGAAIDSSYTYDEVLREGSYLKELELHEVSVVTRGANSKAYVELGETITDDEELNVSNQLYKAAHSRHLDSGTRNAPLAELSKTLDEAIERLQKKVNHKSPDISIAIKRIKQNTLLRK